MASANPNPPKDKALEDEERIEAALDHLDQVHLQLRQLRSTLYRMQRPLTGKQSSYQELYANMVASANESNRELAAFKAEWNGEKTKAILKQAADSQAANPKGITRWKFKDHPGWDKPKQRQPKAEQTDNHGGS